MIHTTNQSLNKYKYIIHSNCPDWLMCDLDVMKRKELYEKTKDGTIDSNLRYLFVLNFNDVEKTPF